MKRTDIYIIEILMLFIYVFSKIFLSSNVFILEYFDIIFYTIFFIVILAFLGLNRNKNYLKRISIRYMIVLLLIYLIVIYLLGCFTGFTRSVYSHSLKSILVNIIPIGFVVLFQELIRSSVANQSKINKRPIILLTIFYIIMDIVNIAVHSNLNNFYLIFDFICITVIPTIAKQFVYSYITYHIDFVPVLLYSLSFSIAPYILPIFPALGSFIRASLLLIFPFIVYIVMKKIVTYREKARQKMKPYLAKLITIPSIMFLTLIIILVSGVFDYKMIAIGSDSMNPVYAKGDAVIYQKMSGKDVKEGDILVFNTGMNVVTHRVIDIEIDRGELYFRTKGDNNPTPDNTLVREKDVLGVVKYIVKYIGKPTVWLNETF